MGCDPYSMAGTRSPFGPVPWYKCSIDCPISQIGSAIFCLETYHDEAILCVLCAARRFNDARVDFTIVCFLLSTLSVGFTGHCNAIRLRNQTIRIGFCILVVYRRILYPCDVRVKLLTPMKRHTFQSVYNAEFCLIWDAPGIRGGRVQ